MYQVKYFGKCKDICTIYHTQEISNLAKKMEGVTDGSWTLRAKPLRDKSLCDGHFVLNHFIKSRKIQ